MNQMQQGLQNWTVGTLNQCKLIGIKSRFALIHRKEQETKMSEKWGNLENLEEKKNQNSCLCSIFGMMVTGQVP